MAKATDQTREAATKRAVVATFTHDETRLIGHALKAYGVVLDEVDRAFPDPEMRVRAADVRRLSRIAFEANAARDWIEKTDRS